MLLSLIGITNIILINEQASEMDDKDFRCSAIYSEFKVGKYNAVLVIQQMSILAQAVNPSVLLILQNTNLTKTTGYINSCTLEKTLGGFTL